MRKEIGANRDEVLWEMPIPEMNLMLHSYYYMNNHDVRKREERIKIHGKFDRIMRLLGRK